MPPYRLLPNAHKELRAAELAYEAAKPGMGQQFVAAAFDVLDAVVQNPLMYAANPRGRRIAMVPRFSYVIHYYIFQGEIVVTAVAHVRRP